MNIYVGNLSYSSTGESLQALFEEHGAVNSVRVITDKFTGSPRGFAFVEMASNDEASAAIAALNGFEFEGKRLRVNEARPREQRPERGHGHGGHGGGHSGGGYRNSNHGPRY